VALGGGAAVQVRTPALHRRGRARRTHLSSLSGCEQHLLELLDADAAFQALVKELDRLGSTYEPDARGKAAAEIHQLPTARMKAQWQLAERHGLGNVLERVAPVRHSADASEMTLSGAYRPLPMRKVAVTVWLYPPTTEIPPTGDPIPKNSESVHDFFPSDSE
jgi:hypothetical protein